MLRHRTTNTTKRSTNQGRTKRYNAKPTNRSTKPDKSPHARLRTITTKTVSPLRSNCYNGLNNSNDNVFKKQTCQNNPHTRLLSTIKSNPLNISTAPPQLTTISGEPDTSHTPHPDRENPTDKKLAWLNQRLTNPPPAKVRDQDIPDSIPNLNDPENDVGFFSTKGFLYHFDEDKVPTTTSQHSFTSHTGENISTATLQHSYMPQSRIDSLRREEKLKRERAQVTDMSQYDDQCNPNNQDDNHINVNQKSPGQSQPTIIHGALGDEIEPPDNLALDADNTTDLEAEAMFEQLHKQQNQKRNINTNHMQHDKKIIATTATTTTTTTTEDEASSFADDTNHATQDTNPEQTTKTEKITNKIIHRDNDDGDDANNNEESQMEFETRQKIARSKMDELYGYGDAEDSHLYTSVDPHAGRAQRRLESERKREQINQNRQESLEKRKIGLDKARQQGEDIAQAVDFEPLDNEVANTVLSRQSLAAYIMSKKAEILPPQARPVFWHGLTPYTNSHGSLLPSAEDVKAPDLDWRTFLDLSQPHLWYPTARLLKRKIIFHTGPTNSGKTYKAMMRLNKAESGLYCGPLRLLAWENYERLNSQGVPCSLLTGQEVIEVAKAQHIASTVEMVSLDRVVDVAVIDEIQMIQDPDRGFAWTRALLGIPAKEVHLCGDATALNWLQEITAMTGEELHVHKYERLSPLTVENEPVMGYQNLRKGDCVVAFSRNDVYSLKKKIEQFTGKKCAIIYGNLPPDIRRQQAKYFNEGELDILVASDAIGTGINLNIGRVVFSSIIKFDGTNFRRLHQSEVLQISGRAGRFSSKEFNHGFVNVMHVPEDLEYVREQFKTPLPPMERAQLLPSTEHLLSFCEKFPEIKLSHYLNSLSTRAKVGELFSICDPTAMSTIAEAIDHIDMPAYNRVMLCYAPLSLQRFKSHRPLLEELAVELTKDKPIPIPKIAYASRPAIPQTPAEVALLEETFTNLEAYIWLWFRLGDALYMHRQAKIDRESCQKIILHYLQNS